MRCPTCKKSGLLVTTKICPRCETQITSDYDMVDEADKLHWKEFSLLKGKIVELATRKERAEQKVSRLKGWNVALILVLFSLFFFRKQPAPVIIENEAAINTLNDSLRQKAAQITDLESQLAARNQKIIKYEIQKGDNLTRISNLFYNDPNLLTEIASKNNIPIPDKIMEGDTLDILIIR